MGLLRLSPVLPYNVLNYALAITPVSFWVYSLTSALATVPWTALYVYLGTFSNNLMDLAKVCTHVGVGGANACVVACSSLGTRGEGNRARASAARGAGVRSRQGRQWS